MTLGANHVTCKCRSFAVGIPGHASVWTVLRCIQLVFFSYPQFYPVSTSLETYLSSLNHLVCWTTQGLGWIWGLNLYKQTLWNKTSICDELTRFPRIWWCFANQFLMLLFLLWLALIQTERSSPEWNKMLYFALRVNAAEQEMLLSRHAVFLSEITQIWLCLPSLCLARQIKY